MADADQEPDSALPVHLEEAGGVPASFFASSQGGANPNQFPPKDLSQSSLSQSWTSEPYKLGFLLAKIEGVNNCPGKISSRESISLVRDPINPSDSKTIKVLNTRDVQAGHIEPKVAAVLAPLIDDEKIVAECIVHEPRNLRNSNMIRCHLHIFAPEEAAEEVKAAISRGGLQLITETSPAFPLSERKKGKGEKRNWDEIFGLVEKNTKELAKMEPLAVEPPKEVIKTELLEHQKVGLGWLVHRENSDELPPFWEDKDGNYVNILTDFMTQERPDPLRGGIFADDMGLGKTLTLLSLIALDKFGSPAVCGTSNAKKSGEEGENFEFVSPVSGAMKRGRARKGCGSCSMKEFKTKKISGLMSDSAPIKHKMTLVVCPPSVLLSWEKQLDDHTIPGKLKLYKYHGSDRTSCPKELRRYDIVLTTYSTLASEQANLDESPLGMIEWWRIILDEAHQIKNANAQQSLAVRKLWAERRWAVTGTPIQNGSFDLFSLMTFLRFQPFSIWCYWLNLIHSPIYYGQSAGLSRLQILMATISLRRTKEVVLPGLPKKTIETCLVDLSNEERGLYNWLETEAKNIVRGWIQRDTLMQNYTTILTIILRLRQVCTSLALCPPDLKTIIPAETIKDVSKNPELLKKALTVLQDGEDFGDCPICISPPEDMVITSCAHIFCRRCILKAMKSSSEKPYPCPYCRRSLTEADLFSAPPETLKKEDQETRDLKQTTSAPQSCKVAALVKLLKASRDQNPAVKSIIYSQFKKMLILLEEPLKEAGFKAIRLDGSMTAKKRARVIAEFESGESDGPMILLASIRSSGEGINLTAASVVYLLEPLWNPAVEEQAMDRVHRIGQTKEVRIVRMIARNSIEERVLEQQELKKRLARDAFVGKREVGEDIRSLLSL